ncbi:MAG: hypothetical protein K9M45_05820 [Kiritimatiellales bacterium]|nr:hypothetical protein [Kiritimatiellales bacterium]
MINVNLPAPEWLWDEVAWIKIHPKWPQNKQPQFWDPVYIEYHTDWIRRLAGEIGAYRNGAAVSWVLGVRVMPNGLNPENVDTGNHPADPAWDLPNTPGSWHYPPGYTAQNWRCKVPGTGAVTDAYMAAVMRAYLQAFEPLGIDCGFRAPKFNRMYGAAAMHALFENPLAMAIDTGCEAGVLEKSSYDRFPVMRHRCRIAGAPGYWEDYNHSAFTARYENPAADFYWRQLIKLDAGVSWSGTYGADLEKYRTHPGYRKAMDFFNKYAGCHNLPDQSPGAWLAFCDGEDLKDVEGRRVRDLSFFMKCSSPPENVHYSRNHSHAALSQEWYCARVDGVCSFDVAGDFAHSFSTGVQFRVTFKAEPDVDWVLKYRVASGSYTTAGAVSGIADGAGWCTKTFERTPRAPLFTGDQDLLIETVPPSAVTLHMMELLR